MQIIRLPLISSHLANGEVKTTGVVVTPYGCGTVTHSTPVRTSFGAERLAASHGSALLKLANALSQKKLAEQLVIRSREGDQNAMAIIAMTRESAIKGSPKAVSGIRFIIDYAKANPPKADVDFGGESIPCSCNVIEAVNLANGTPLTNSRVKRLADSFGHENDTRIFVKGFKDWSHNKALPSLDGKQRDTLKLGKTIGYAKALQLVRLPYTPIKPFSPLAAWELGE